ncbi:MAG: LacI family DNA-binding transcriptional regulator [Segetibacter sp.]
MLSVIMENVNLKTLAVQLHLSAATVSKALRDSHEISAETKQRVLELAAKLNYIPNPYASSLRKRVSKTIAVVIPEVADSFLLKLSMVLNQLHRTRDIMY